MTLVRGFQNADLPDLIRVWNSHHESAALAYPVGLSQFYTSVIDRQVFDSGSLYVAVVEERLVGFAHVAQQKQGPGLAGVWTEQGAASEEAAAALLQQAIDNGWNRAGLTLADRAGYVGLTPYMGLVGVADADGRQTGWLKRAGFQVADRHACVQISIPTFRPPVDRRVMMLRRTTVLEEVNFVPATDPLREAGWGYLDPLQLQLRDRNGRPLAEITAWTSGFGEIFPYSEVLLTNLTTYPGAPEGADLLLVTESLRELATRRFLTARTAVDDAHPALASFWQSLGFRIVASGAIYSKV